MNKEEFIRVYPNELNSNMLINFDIFNESGNIVKKKGEIIDAGFLLKINFLKIYKKSQSTFNSAALDDLLISEYNQNLIKTAVQNNKGIFLIVCPEKSGKSLIMNSLIINLKEDGFSTAIINNSDIENTFGIKHFNIATLNNERILETVEIVLSSKEQVIGIDDIDAPSIINRLFELEPNDKIIFLTITASSSFETLTKLENIVDKSLISKKLNGIFFQKLIPVLCSDCKEQYQSDFDELNKIFKCDQDDKLKLFNPKGCPVCGNKGYFSVLGIHEFLKVSDEIKEIIENSNNINDIKNIAYESGFQDMKLDCLKKILCGLISLSQYNETL
ncbi:MAG: hypothetical protein PHC34_09535 [Candidatus Gastranaerophilales bacterium]|nr:hypothetical protein [Candidatus Gastranaerophilales bacterium]